MAMGHFFSESDEKGIARVAVLGSALALDLFGGQDPLGQKIKIRRESFEVIGVMKARGTVAFENVDDQMFIPLFSAQKLLLGINHVNFIRTKIGSQADMDLAILEVTELLRQRHNISNPVEDDFSVRNQAEALDMLTTITNALKFFLAAIAAISLLVGGIGIMNIMYIAVSERTREIGLRKAVGANRSYLLKQFLTEAIIITMTGGVIGIIFGALISLAVALGANYLGYNWELIITLPSVLVGFILSTAIGLIFGYFPAQKAAALDPIIALRYE